MGVHLPAAGVQHRPAGGAEQGEQHKILHQCRPQGSPVAGKQHLYQREQVHQNGLTQQVQHCKRVEALFGHTASSVRMEASVSACTEGTPGSTSRPPGQCTSSTLAPASHSSGVRSSCTPVTARRGDLPQHREGDARLHGQAAGRERRHETAGAQPQGQHQQAPHRAEA